MLIEDDQMMRSLLKTLLSLEGFQVAESGDVGQDEIMMAIQAEKPDGLLLDIHLRHSNGIDILKQVRKEKKHHGIRILTTSGMDLKDKCIQAGADGFLLKPYMPDELIQWLKTNIQQREQ